MRNYEEYGGCLHLELPYGKDYFSKYEGKVELDSGRSALQYIIGIKDYKRIWLPLYNCPLVTKRLEPMDIDIVYYNINNDFRPQVNPAEFHDKDLFCWINYWGCMQDDLVDEMGRLQFTTPADVIIDNIPAFFYPPKSGMYNIYSCRKFIGVPDGAYVIWDGQYDLLRKNVGKLGQFEGYKRYTYLLRAMEQGSNKAYGDYLESEDAITDRAIPCAMSKPTKRVLSGVDYEDIKNRRIKNFRKVDEILGQTNLLNINKDTITPSVYPYLSRSIALREKLIENRIYVSMLWKHILSDNRANIFEKEIAEYMIPLPIDQRYSTDDMEYIASIVRKIEETG